MATCPVIDEEMGRRIAKHQKAREGKQWQTVEAPVDLAGAITRSAAFDVVLVDCLTLWINNLMYEAENIGREISEEQVAERCGGVLEACRLARGKVIFVTNEVGMGVVPDNALARKYRDMVGRCNQVMGAGADCVTLVACGIPMTLKGE